jgi:hypothetical protein
MALQLRLASHFVEDAEDLDQALKPVHLLGQPQALCIALFPALQQPENELTFVALP